LVDGKHRIAASGDGVVDRGGGSARASPPFLERGRARVTSAPSFGDAVRRHEPALEERLDPAQVILRVIGLGLQLEHGRFGGRTLLLGANLLRSRRRQGGLAATDLRPSRGDRPALRVDFLENERHVGAGTGQSRLVGPAIDREEELSRAHVLVVHDAQVHDRTADLGRDPDDVGAHGGVVGTRLHERQPIGVETAEHRDHDDQSAERAADDEAGRGGARAVVHGLRLYTGRARSPRPGVAQGSYI
jgi:hypothetical protein